MQSVHTYYDPINLLVLGDSLTKPFGHAALTRALRMYIIEEIDPETGRVIQTVATATNAIIGRAAFEAACAYDAKAYLIYRIKARVISERKQV